MAELDPAAYQRVPFDAAIAHLREKINLDTDSWRDVTDDEHDAAFVVSGAKGSVLSEFRTAVDRAISEGQRPEDFRQEFDRISEGWEFNGDAAWRSDTIYFTNLRASYGRGRDQLQFDPDVVAVQPYVKYEHSDAQSPRPLHLALDQQVFRKTDVPFALPNGYGCSCRYTSLSQRDVERLGLEVSELGRGDSIPVEVDGQTYNPAIEPAEGWDRMPNPNPQERREEILRRIADRSVPEIGDYLRQFIANFEPAPTAEPPAPPAPASALAAFGETLRVDDADAPVVQQHLADLELVPEVVAVAVREAGLREIHLGDRTVPDLDANQALRGQQPRGHYEGATWDEVPGAYNPEARSVVAGRGEHGATSLILHEYGHAVGDLLNLDKSPLWTELHALEFDRLPPYLQQDGPRTRAGAEEFFAETFAEVLKDPARARELYGAVPVRYLQAALRDPRAAQQAWAEADFDPLEELE